MREREDFRSTKDLSEPQYGETVVVVALRKSQDRADTDTLDRDGNVDAFQRPAVDQQLPFHGIEDVRLVSGDDQHRYLELAQSLRKVAGRPSAI